MENSKNWASMPCPVGRERASAQVTGEHWTIKSPLVVNSPAVINSSSLSLYFSALAPSKTTSSGDTDGARIIKLSDCGLVQCPVALHLAKGKQNVAAAQVKGYLGGTKASAETQIKLLHHDRIELAFQSASASQRPKEPIFFVLKCSG